MKWHLWILWFIIQTGGYSAFSQKTEYRPYERFIRFENLSVNEGLSQSTGRDIIQDSRGYIWIATQDGLNRYDGKNFKVYNTSPLDLNSISDNFILDLHEDKNGIIWIGTNGSGIDRFIPELEKFENFRNQEENFRSLSNNTVNCIYEDSEGVLWFGTNYGLNRYHPQSRSFTRHLLDSSNQIVSNIMSLFEDSKGNFWIGTNGNGLLLIDKNTGTIIRQFHNNDSIRTIGGNTIECILEDSQGNIWFGGGSSSLTKYNPETGKFKVYINDPEDPKSISGDAIYSLYESKTKTPTLWIGTVRNGLCRYNPDNETFTTYQHDPSDPFSLSNNIIFSLTASEDGTMWIGTGGGGISKFSLRKNKFSTFRNPEGSLSNFIWAIRPYNKDEILIGTQNRGLYLFNRNTQAFRHFLFDKKNPEASANYDVYSLHTDKSNTLWIGTNTQGIYEINEEKGIHNHYKPELSTPGSLSASWIRSIYEESDSIIWFGTANGLNRFNKIKKTFKSYLPNPIDSTALSFPTIQGIIKDQYGDLWVGTYGGGLNRLNPETGKFTRYQHDPDEPHSLSNDRIRTIYMDEDGEIWIGTDNGLNHYNREDDNFEAVTMDEGLPNNVIYSILPDREGNFWMSTNLGICVYNPDTKDIKNYDVQDGLQSNEFNTGAYYLAEDGEIFLGGINGFNIFHPDSIQDNPYIPPVRITELKLYNFPVKPSEGGIITSCISRTDKIRLKYNQNFLSFEFASFNYLNSESNQYKYKMEGLDNGWVDAGSRAFADYPNLRPGTYTFHVIGSNNDGIWNKVGDKLQIIISPPWWKSPPALIIYGILTLVLIYSYIRWRTYKLAKDKRELEEQVRLRTLEIANQKEEIAAQRDSLEELNAGKDKLFAIIGHDLKNPLTSLLSVSHTLRENLKELTKEELKKAIDSVDQSAQNLFKLLDNLLEWTKSQTGRTPVLRRQFYLNDVVRDNILYLSSSANKKQITVEHEFKESTVVYADKNMISTVVRNLLANAIKFTHRGGKIKISTAKNDNEATIRVMDNGIGIGEEDKKKLFRIDYKASQKGTEDEKGSGLGLLLCKDFVEKNGGIIWADSEPGKGSTFSFTIPNLTEPQTQKKTKKHFKDN